ncbi:MAG: hypothetical protein FGM43_02145 [Sinobacteraceae bacterium]|nr:hypothetical protein [Nevskiaceae bacterium]
MRELVIILADFFLREAEAASPALRVSLSRARFGAARSMRGGWRDWLARREGREDLALADPAAVVAAAAVAAAATAVPPPTPSGQGVPEHSPWLVTPLHLLAGMKTVHVPMNAVMTLTPVESRQLASEFAAIFGADGLALQPIEPSGFLLHGLDAEGAETVEPARLLGGTLDEGLPSGPGSRRLRQLMTEVDLWLHELPLNRAREARNEPRLSTLWVWGGGQGFREGLPRSAAREGWAALYADDAWVAAFAQLTRIDVRALPRDATALLSAPGADAAMCVVLPSAALGLAALDAAWIRPAIEAVHEGKLRGVSIVGNDRCVTLSSGDAWRFWRPMRDVLAALAEGTA